MRGRGVGLALVLQLREQADDVRLGCLSVVEFLLLVDAVPGKKDVAALPGILDRAAGRNPQREAADRYHDEYLPALGEGQVFISAQKEHSPCRLRREMCTSGR